MRVGPYELERLLGEGAMGRVYSARHVTLGVVRAVKVLARSPSGSSAARFQREAEALARVHHPGVVTVHEVGQDGGAPWFAMDLVQGESLEAVLGRERRLPLPRALDVAAQLARGVAALHAAGVVHRDLKPGNCLLTPEGRAVVIDLGLAIDPERDDRLTRTGATVGTPLYMAPEQLSSAAPTPRTDVHALGLILFELVTGEVALGPRASAHEVVLRVLRPERRAPSEVDPALPAALDALVLRATAREPAARHAAADELALAIEELGRSPGPSARAARRARLALRGGGALVAVAAVAALLGALAAAWPAGAEPARPAPVVPPARAPAAPDDAADRRLIDGLVRALATGDVARALVDLRRLDARAWERLAPHAAELDVPLRACAVRALALPATDRAYEELALVVRARALLRARGLRVEPWPDVADALIERLGADIRSPPAALVEGLSRAALHASRRRPEGGVIQAGTEAARSLALLCLDVEPTYWPGVALQGAPRELADAPPAQLARAIRAGDDRALRALSESTELGPILRAAALVVSARARSRSEPLRTSATADLRRAVALDPTSDGVVTLARLEEAAGRRDEALARLDAYLDRGQGTRTAGERAIATRAELVGLPETLAFLRERAPRWGLRAPFGHEELERDLDLRVPPPEVVLELFPATRVTGDSRNAPHDPNREEPDIAAPSAFGLFLRALRPTARPGDLDRAIELAPTFEPARSHRAGLLARDGRADDALGDLEACVGSQEPRLLASRAVLRAVAGRFDEAVIDATQALGPARKERWARASLAGVHLLRGDHTRALEVVAVDLRPGQLDPPSRHVLLACAALLDGESRARAVALLRDEPLTLHATLWLAALGVEPAANDRRTERGRAVRDLAAGRLDPAALRRLAPEVEPDLDALAGLVAERAGDAPGARRCFERVLEGSPEAGRLAVRVARARLDAR